MAIKRTAKKRVAVKKVETPEPALSQPGAVPLLLYRRIALTFVFVVAAALVTILYLSTVQAVIHVDSTQMPLSTSFITDVLSTPVEEGDVRGTVAAGTVGKTQTFTASGEGKKLVDGIATGEVTIFNKMDFDQQLVVKTRLLSALEGVLFRLKEGVVVSAGGSVTVEVYADEPGASGNVAPSSFRIPGLSEARQELVYAESDTAFTGGVSEVAVVSQEEIDEAVVTVTDALVGDAIAMLRAQAGGDLTGVAYTTQELERAVSVKAGDEAAQYDVTLSLDITTVFYDRAALAAIASRKLYEGLGQGQTFANILTDEMQVDVAGGDEETQQANVRVTLSGTVVSATTSEALRVDRFVGLSEEDVRTLLINEGIAQAVDVEFFPFWVSTVPRLKDHIYIDIR